MSRPHRVPVATLLIVGANLAAAFAEALAPGTVDAWSPGPAGWLPAMFLHRDLLHLAGNLVFLAAVGPAVEFAAGSLRLLAVYLAGGLAGYAAHDLLARTSQPLVGASASVAAVLGCYALRYSALRVPILPGRGAPLGWVAALWVLLQGCGSLAQNEGPSFWSHLGGFGMGLAMGLAFRLPRLAEVQFGHEALERLNERGPFAVMQAAREMLRRHPDDPKALRQLAEAARSLGEREEERAANLRLLEVLPEALQAEPLRRLADLDALGELPSLRRMMLADRFAETEADVALRLWRSVAEGPPDDPQVPEALFALALRERGGPWLGRLAAEYPVHPVTDRARLKGMLG
ncbi:MAG: rhomboid family intramembrane serine protease [Fimbriimonadales bacterium]|nr:rhomboid family intramembrane serine protease [Fimbriimonadales bacterium]